MGRHRTHTGILLQRTSAWVQARRIHEEKRIVDGTPCSDEIYNELMSRAARNLACSAQSKSELDAQVLPCRHSSLVAQEIM